MRHRFRSVIPRIPVYKRNTYEIPESYAKHYKDAGVSDPDEQKALFFVTQFGGFRFKRMPSYLRDREKFFAKWFKSKNENGFLNFKANPTFITSLGNISVQPLTRTSFSNANYSDEFLEENGFSRGEANEIEALQRMLNEHYKSVRIDVAIPDSGITFEDKIDLSRFNSVVHLQYKPRAGGRFFQTGPGGSYQRISSSLRHFLTINGEKTAEIDLTAATLQFLNIALKNFLGYFPIPRDALNPDPYQHILARINTPAFKRRYDGSRDVTRDELKSILYTWIYSQPNAQERNVNRSIRLIGQDFSYSDLIGEFSNLFKAMSELKSLPLVNQGIYPPHIVIYKEESRFAREVLRRGCIEKKLLILPIHDSFVVPKRSIKGLESLVCSVSEDMYGYVLPYKRKM